MLFKSAHRRLLDPRSEDGVALVLALAVLIFFSVVVVAATTMGSSTQSTASTGSSQQTTYALAETGINDALGVVEDVPANDPQNASLLGSAVSPNVTTTAAGTVSWYGVYDAANRIWTITSTSSVANPVAGAPVLHSTLQRTVSLTVALNGNWDRIYQDDASSCLTVPNGTNIPSNVTAHGNLCVTGATVGGAGSTVIVGGTTTLTPGTVSATNAVMPAATGSGWTNSQNISAQDNTAATASIAANSNGATLSASNFGFTIPTGSTISGITVQVVHWASSSSPGCCVHDLHVYLIKNGVAGGTDLANASWWPTDGPGGPGPAGTSNYGAANNLWGQTWAPADINSSTFGVQLIPHNYSASTVTGDVDFVQVTVTYTPPAANVGIGSSAAPVAAANLGGTCNYNAQGAHTPCTSTDHVWATTVTMGAPAMNKPIANFANAYTTAAPGPKHGCDVKTGTPPIFDNNSVYDDSDSMIKLAGNSTASYTCISKDANGNVIGQLSWNESTQVLTIFGVIFIDGEADFGDGPGTSVIHYQGRGAIYAPGGSHIDVPVCAGGTGSVSCVTTGMSNWDPSTNLLVMVVGDKMPANNNDCKIDETTSAFQGVYWSKNVCDIKGGGGAISGPIIATDISIGAGTQFYAWPPLGAILPGVNAGAGVYTFTLGNQTGS